MEKAGELDFLFKEWYFIAQSPNITRIIFFCER